MCRLDHWACAFLGPLEAHCPAEGHWLPPCLRVRDLVEGGDLRSRAVCITAFYSGFGNLDKAGMETVWSNPGSCDVDQEMVMRLDLLHIISWFLFGILSITPIRSSLDH